MNNYIFKNLFEKMCNGKVTPLKLMTYNIIIAALYATLTLALAPISFGAIQFRISELLNWLTWLNPFAIPGLVLGCLISNLFSSLGIFDVIFGTLATFLTVFFMSKTKNIFIASIYAPIFSILIGVVILLGGVPLIPAAIDTSTIMISEFIIMSIIGIPIVKLIQSRLKINNNQN